MSTLDNVIDRGDGATSPSARLTSGSLPETGSSAAGVSVRYAPSPDKSWYVLRATYQRAGQVYDFITSDGQDSDAYVAMHLVRRKVKGRSRRVREPLIGSLVFVYCSEAQVERYLHQTPEISFVHPYYDHCVTLSNGTNPKLVVDYEQMMSFIRVTSIDDDNIMLVDPEYVHYQSGDLVRVTEGRFEGVTGRVARAAGQQRVIVELTGIALVATAYIPKACLEKV